jgi:hypothetical protein
MPWKSGLNGRIDMKQFLKSCTALTLSLAFTTQVLAQEALKEIGKGEARSPSLPGPAISNAATRTRLMIGSQVSKRRPAAKSA